MYKLLIKSQRLCIENISDHLAPHYDTQKPRQRKTPQKLGRWLSGQSTCHHSLRTWIQIPRTHTQHSRKHPYSQSSWLTWCAQWKSTKRSRVKGGQRQRLTNKAILWSPHCGMCAPIVTHRNMSLHTHMRKRKRILKPNS